MNMTETRKDDRPRLKLPRDLFEAFEERAKRLNLSNVDTLRELLKSAESDGITATELKAQRPVLDTIVEATKDVTSGLEEAQVSANRRHEAVIAELRTLRSETVKLGAVIHARKSDAPVTSRSTDQPAPRPVKRQGFEFTFWHLMISIGFFVIGYFGGLNAR